MIVTVRIGVEGRYSDVLVKASVERRVPGVAQDAEKLDADEIETVARQTWQAVAVAKDEIARQFSSLIEEAERRGRATAETPGLDVGVPS